MSYDLSATGVVSAVEILDSQPPRVFDEATLKAMAKLRFKPPYEAGRHARAFTFVPEGGARDQRDISSRCLTPPSYAELNSRQAKR